MKLTTLFLISFLACTSFGQVATEFEPRQTQIAQSALVGEFVQDNYGYGEQWQLDYAADSTFYQLKYGVNPTEYQYFVDYSIKNLGLTLTSAFKWTEPVNLLANLLYTEAIKHKAAMDQIDDYLTFAGHPPTLYQDFMYQQMCLLDFAIVEACSKFVFSHDPLSSQEAQLKYFSDLLFLSLVDWNAQYIMENDSLKAYLTSIGEVPDDWELWMGFTLRTFVIYWIDVINDYI